eukprot:13772090-Ditylum_brightwellii.AAC.1
MDDFSTAKPGSANLANLNAVRLFQGLLPLLTSVTTMGLGLNPGLLRDPNGLDPQSLGPHRNDPWNISG